MGRGQAGPSKACEPCRVKRRKCDYKLPSCSQCVRANVACPGYRDSFSLRHRDQTRTIARKAQGRASQNEPRSPERGSDCCDVVRGADGCSAVPAERPSASSSLTDLSSSSRLSIPTDSDSGSHHRNLDLMIIPDHPGDIALNYFLGTCAYFSSFYYLPPLYMTLPESECLRAAVLAPSLALLSQSSRSPPLRRRAYVQYAKALTYTNSALSDPHLAVLDSTLLSVLLLGYFEGLVFNGRKTPDSWGNHARGSMALLRLRGDQQFQSALGRFLFIHASNNVMASCAQWRLKVPPELHSVQHRAARVLGKGHFSLELGSTLDDFIALRTGIGRLPAAQLLQKAVELDNKVLDLLDRYSKEAPFTAAPITPKLKHVGAYKSLVYCYPSQWVARRWNIFRLLRVFLCQSICKLSSQKELELHDPRHGLDKSPSQLRIDSLTSIEAVISDVLHSVPFALELSERPFLSARSLIFPLANIAASTVAPPSAAAYARDRLAFIGSQYGLEQATNSISMLAEHKNMEDWIILSLVS